MSRNFEEITTYTRNGFDIVVDKSWDDCNPAECFSESELGEVLRGIESGKYDWFVLRVRAFIDEHEMGSAYLGGCLYEDPQLTLVDGTVEHLIEQCMAEAQYEIRRLHSALEQYLEMTV